MLLAIYEITLELDRCADLEDDTDVILDKLNKTIEARKVKLDALIRLDAKIEAGQSGEEDDASPAKKGEIEKNKNTVKAVLGNLAELDDKIQSKLKRVQESLSGEMRDAHKSQQCYESYVSHEEDITQGKHLDTRQ